METKKGNLLAFAHVKWKGHKPGDHEKTWNAGPCACSMFEVGEFRTRSTGMINVSGFN